MPFLPPRTRYCCSVAQLCLTLCNPVDCSTSGFPVLHVSWSLLKLTSIESVMPYNLLILCRPPFLLPSIFPSIRVFSNESGLRIRRSKYWSFSFSISPSNEYSGLIFFRIDWFDLLAVRGTLRRLLQHHTSKASILCHSVYFMVQLTSIQGLPCWLRSQESAWKAGATGDSSSTPESGRSLGGGHGSPLQYSCLKNFKDCGASQATVHRVTRSQT